MHVREDRASAASATPSGRGSLIDGKNIASRLRERLTQDVSVLKAKGVTPGLSVVLVGDDPASAVYVRNKNAACEEVGMKGETIRMRASTTQAELIDVVHTLNERKDVHGILVQMPLPKQIDSDTVLRHIDPAKDVDGFHPVNVGGMLVGNPEAYVPCTPAGVMMLLREYGVKTAGAHAVVVGRSNIVGKPMMALLVQPGTDATVTVCHSRTKDMAAHIRRADIVIAAVGKPRLITGEMIKPGAVVVDVGINRIDDPSHPKGSRLVGDVDFESARQVASLITPVPGGVGPMTIAMLLANTLQAAKRSAAK